MNVFFHNSAGYKSKIKLLVELCFLSEGSRDNPSLTSGFWGLLTILGFPWLVDASLQSLSSASNVLFSWVSVSSALPPFKDARFSLKACPNPVQPHLDNICKILFPKKVTFTGFS